MIIKHAKVCTIPDEEGNDEEIKPSDWNNSLLILDNDGNNVSDKLDALIELLPTLQNISGGTLNIALPSNSASIWVLYDGFFNVYDDILESWLNGDMGLPSDIDIMNRGSPGQFISTEKNMGYNLNENVVLAPIGVDDSFGSFVRAGKTKGLIFEHGFNYVFGDSTYYDSVYDFSKVIDICYSNQNGGSIAVLVVDGTNYKYELVSGGDGTVNGSVTLPEQPIALLGEFAIDDTYKTYILTQNKLVIVKPHATDPAQSVIDSTITLTTSIGKVAYGMQGLFNPNEYNKILAVTTDSRAVEISLDGSINILESSVLDAVIGRYNTYIGFITSSKVVLYSPTSGETYGIARIKEVDLLHSDPVMFGINGNESSPT